MLNFSERWEAIRRWIDGEEKDAIPERIEKAEKMKSESEIFLQRLVNSIEELLKREITRIPATNRAYIPEKFVVFVSSESDKNLSSEKLKFFKDGLSVMIYQRAKEMAGALQLNSKKVDVEITIDGSLEKDEIEVRAVSENAERTIEEIESIKRDLKNNFTVEDLGTIEDTGNNFGILYRINVWRDSELLDEHPIILRTNTIGRDDGANIANIRLKTDNRFIARLHAEIALEENGEIWVTALHKNPTLVSEKPIRKGEKAKLEPDGKIRIYEFEITLSFPE